MEFELLVGNSWGSENGKEGLGFGQQDEIYGCSDVSISPANNTNSETISSEQPTSPPTFSSTIADDSTFRKNTSLYERTALPNSTRIQINEVPIKIHSRSNILVDTPHQLPELSALRSANSKASKMRPAKFLFCILLAAQLYFLI